MGLENNGERVTGFLKPLLLVRGIIKKNLYIFIFHLFGGRYLTIPFTHSLNLPKGVFLMLLTRVMARQKKGEFYPKGIRI